MLVSTITERERARRWFLDRGLPLVLAPRVRAHHIVRRTAPFLAGLLVAELILVGLWKVFDVPDAEFDLRMTRPGWVVLFWGLLLLMVVLPPLAGWWVSRLNKGPGGGWVAAAVVLPAVVAVPLIGHVVVGDWWRLPWGWGILAHLVACVSVVGLNYLGVGSVIWWAMRFALGQLGAMGKLAGRALPLLMLTVVVFFTGELWQWARVVDRGIVWRTVGFLGAVAILFMVTALRDEVRGVRRRLGSREEITRLVLTTPMFALRVPEQTRKLARRERINVLGILVLSQAIQVAIFTTLVVCLFVALGSIMLPVEVIETWAGGPVSPGSWFGLRLPLPNELLDMSLFVGVLSGLYFTVHSTIDPQYRDRFFDPLVEDVAESLAGREVYLAAYRTER